MDFKPPWKCTQLNDLAGIDNTLAQDEENVWFAGDYESFCTLCSFNVARIVYDVCDSQSLYFKRRMFYLPAGSVLKRANAIRWYLIWQLRERKIVHYSRGVVVPAAEDATAFSRWKSGRVLAISNGTKRVEQLPVCRVLIVDELIAKTGTGEFQYSNNWHKSGDYTRDLSRAFGAVFKNESVLDILVDNIDTWETDQISFLLMLLSHADCRNEIGIIEQSIKKESKYRTSRHYRHVQVYKLFGVRTLKFLFKLAKKTRYYGLYLNRCAR